MNTLLEHARRLLALAHTGLHYTQSDYERERYEEIASIARALLSMDSDYSSNQLKQAWQLEDGYVTPKLDVRGAIFRDDAVLLVRERSDGKWTIPGGFADINEWPSLSVTKEIEQESGFSARVLKLAAVHDRARHNYPPFMFHIWKLLFVCEITGGEARISNETDAVEFFALDALPPLSTGRITAEQITLLHHHYRQPELPTEFD
ncbi:MAG TPA: NUDIX hydrolase [Steroidobacteraceae bacterium]|nr:NUDIX hydrolase [Steroidobacteraceae bacterium]